MWDKHKYLHGRVKYFYTEDDYIWCQGDTARNKTDVVRWDDDNAYYFSLLGAVYKLYMNTKHWPIISRHLGQIFNPFWEWPLMEWNDNPKRTYQEVLDFLDRHKL